MDPEPDAALTAPRALREYTQWIYALQGLSVLIGLLTARSVALRFAVGLPSIVAVVMNYLRRAEARGGWLESHFGWQILGIGFVIAILGLGLIGLWVIYRVARGWLALREGRAMPLPP
jgi:uncharacterized membrane protein